jgi:hypothetical protein
MKKSNNLIPLLMIICGAAFFFSGCSSHSYSPTQPKVGLTSQVYMPQAQGSSESIVLNNNTAFVSETYSAKYGGFSGANSAISVSFIVDPSKVDAFNGDSTSYLLLPENAYSLSNTKATIPAGSKSTSALQVDISGVFLQKGKTYVLPITVKVDSGGATVNKNLQTSYFVVHSEVSGLQDVNTPIIITGWLSNPRGYDQKYKGQVTSYDDSVTITHQGGYEYIQLMALKDIDFSKTPYSVVAANMYGTAPSKGWAAGGGCAHCRTYKFDLTEGTAKAGTFFYVGSSSKVVASYWPSGLSQSIAGANWIRSIAVDQKDASVKVTGDGFGPNNTSFLGNGGAQADGIGVFEGTHVTKNSVPIDAVFYGNGKSSAAPDVDVANGNGLLIPKSSDLYSATNPETGAPQPFFGEGTNTFIAQMGGSGHWFMMGGVASPTKWLSKRNPTFLQTSYTTTLSDITIGPGVTKFKQLKP